MYSMFGSTIAAISTPRGKGGVAVIRISGDEAISICENFVFPKSKKKLGEIRRGEGIFAGGEFRITCAENGYFEFIRYNKEEKGYILVAANMADEAIKVHVSGGTNLYTGKRVVGYPTLGKGEFVIVKMKGEVK